MISPLRCSSNPNPIRRPPNTSTTLPASFPASARSRRVRFTRRLWSKCMRSRPSRGTVVSSARPQSHITLSAPLRSPASCTSPPSSYLSHHRRLCAKYYETLKRALFSPSARPLLRHEHLQNPLRRALRLFAGTVSDPSTSALRAQAHGSEHSWRCARGATGAARGARRERGAPGARPRAGEMARLVMGLGARAAGRRPCLSVSAPLLDGAAQGCASLSGGLGAGLGQVLVRTMVGVLDSVLDDLWADERSLQGTSTHAPTASCRSCRAD